MIGASFVVSAMAFETPSHYRSRAASPGRSLAIVYELVRRG